MIGLLLGPAWLLVLAAAFVLAALIPLQRMGEVHTDDPEATKPVTYRLSHAPRRDVFANFCFNIESAVGVMVWPIYLAIEIKTYEGIGVVSALTAVVAVVVVVIAGHRGDRGKDRHVLREGVAISSVVDFLRLIPMNSIGITILSVGYRASLVYMMNSWTSTYYFHTKRKGIPYVMSMEIGCDLAYVALWSTLLAVSLVASAHTLFVVAFVIAGIAAWGCLLISKQGELESATPYESTQKP